MCKLAGKAPRYAIVVLASISGASLTRGAERVTTPRAPKYLTTTQACSCPGYWYRRTCKHYRAYREAVALVVAQDAVNGSWSIFIPVSARHLFCEWTLLTGR